MCDEKLAFDPTMFAALNVAVPAVKAIFVLTSASHAKESAITEPMFTMFCSAKSAPNAFNCPLELISPLAVMFPKMFVYPLEVILPLKKLLVSLERSKFSSPKT